jgi:hypothetical protein
MTGGTLLAPRKGAGPRKVGTGREGRESRERDRERREMAFKVAKDIQKKKAKELQAKGLSGQELKDRLPSVGETADYLYKTQSDMLDRLAEERRKRMQQLSDAKRKSKKKLGRLSEKLERSEADFRKYLDKKRKSSEGGKERSEPKKAKKRETRTKERRKTHTPRESKSDGSLKGVLDDARKMREERTQRPRMDDRSKGKIRGKEVEKYHEIKHYVPKVRDKEVKSYKQLEEIVKKDFPGLMRVKGFDKMMEGGKKHFDLIEKLRGKQHLEYGDVAKLSREIDRDICSVQDYATRGKPPRIYTALESAISRPEGLVKIEELVRKNNGIRNMEDIQRRLGNYYAEKEYRGSPNYNKDHEMVVKYFKFIDHLKDGGSLTEIGRQIDTHQVALRRWYDAKAPWMVQLSSCIPDETPKAGHVWLPMETGPKNNPGRFIEVPREITSHHQIAEVLKQVKSLQGPEFAELEKRFGPSTKTDSFMYALGSLLADGSTQFARDSNLAGSRFQQPLGRSYDWSKRYGEGTGYHLSKIGIKMYRWADRDYNPESVSYPSSGAYDFQSQNSPLITWMRRSCLGLRDSDSKTHDSVDAKWILSAPKEWRTPFLQGVCDGDGCASIKAQYLSIGTSSNNEFYKDLLKSFGIKSHKGDGAVAINAQDSVLKANEIGMFRYATSRKNNLEKLSRMIESFDYSRKPTSSDMESIRKMRSEGKSWGTISEVLYNEKGYTWPHHSISYKSKKLGIE